MILSEEERRKLLTKRKYYRDHPEEALERIFDKMQAASEDDEENFRARRESEAQTNKEQS